MGDLRVVLITGATGLVGRRLAEVLRDRGADVAAFEGDVTDAAAVREAAAGHGADTVFHLAAQSIVATSDAAPAATFETNVLGTWNVLEACRLEGVERTVVAASERVYAPSDEPRAEHAPLAPRSAYGASKAAADVLARSYWPAFGVPVATTRFANVYGEGDRQASRLVPELVAAVVEGRRPVIRSDGSPQREYLHVDDAVAAYLAIAGALDDGVARGEAYNAGGGRPVSVRELVETLLRVAGADVEPEFLGGPAAAPDIQRVDSGKLRAHTGWAPRIGLDEGLRRTLAAARAGASAAF